MRPGALVVLGKQPLPGQVKTRMSPPLSLEQAAGLYAALLDDVLETSVRLCAALGLTPTLALHPPAACEPFAARVPPGLRVVAQRGVGLAERMSCAVAEAAAAGARPVLLRGSDSPLLGEAVVGEALAALDTADVVLAPDVDGGYGLVGLRRPVPGLFEHAMSTGRVFEDTRANALERGLRVATVCAGFDLDTVADLSRLARARGEHAERLCPRTLSFLDTHD
ncbi:MAG: glycosyltransferase, partial [Deltaproteobacteria bacterium]|nr:glycosyltransferase [Deltaproteobacteria bacterium]